MSATNIISAFTDDQVSRLTGVSKNQLRSWDRSGFFCPAFAEDNRRRPLSRIYSLRDVMSLRVLNTLRNEINVPLSHLKEVKEKLAHLGNDAWHRVTLYVLNKRVIFFDPEMRANREIVSGQGILQIPLADVRAKTEREIEKLLRRDRSTVGTLAQRRGVAHNSLVVSGTRIPVKSIRRFAEDGYSVAEILKEYPTLTEADVKAALGSGKAA